MSARNMSLTSLRPETSKVKLRQAHDTPRSLRIHQRSERGNAPIWKPRMSTDIQFGANVLEKRKDWVGVDPASPSAKRGKISSDAVQQGAPVACIQKSPTYVSGNGRESSEQSECRVLRPRKRQTASTSGSSSRGALGGFRKVRLSEDDFSRVINRRIKVFWDIDNEWYSGWIKRYDPTNRLHHVVYDDHDEEWVSLERDIFVLEVLPGESFGKRFALSSENAQNRKYGGAGDSQEGGIHDSQMGGIEGSQKRRNRRGERLRTDAERRRGGDVHDSEKCGIVDGSRALLKSGEYDCTPGRDEHRRLGSAVGGFGASAFSSASDDVCETSLVSQSSIAESSTNPPGAELVSDKNPDIFLEEPAKRRTVVKTYYRKRRRKFTSSESVGDVGKGIRLLNSEKTPNTCCREHQSELQCSPLHLREPSCPFLVPSLWSFSRSLANLSGSVPGFIPTVEMEICMVENLSGMRKVCFWGTVWEVLMNLSAVLTTILHSEGNRCPVVATGAPRLDVLPAAVQSMTVRLSASWCSASSPLAYSLECCDKWATAMCIDLNGFLREIGILRNIANTVSSPLVLDGSVYTFRPGIGFVNDFELNNVGDRYFISGLSFENLIPQHLSRDFLCIDRRRGDSVVIAKMHRKLPSFSLIFGAAPDFFMALHLKLLLGNMTGLSSPGSDIAGSSYMLKSPDVNNSKADVNNSKEGIVERNNTVFPAFRSSGVLTDESRVRGNLLESSGHQRAFGEDLTAWFNVHGCPFSEHSKIEASVSPRNTSAGATFNQDFPVLPVLKFRTTDNGKWRLVGISKPSSTEGKISGVIGSGADCVSLLPRERAVLAVHDGFREGDKFGAGADSSGARDGFSKSKALRRRRGRPSRKDKEDRIKEIPMDSSNMELDLASLLCSANILLIGEDRCWRESDAVVKLEYSDLNEWLLAVKLHGLTKFTHKPQELKSGTSKRNAHSIIWKGGRDWRLEFSDKNQWNLFKEMHGECYNRNLRAASIRCIPIPGVRLLEDNDCSSGIPFLRPSLMYIQMAECETTRALSNSRVAYDMDSDDEEWLGQFNSGVDSDGGSGLMKVAEETFEKIIDKLEKAAFRKQSECLGVGEVAKICSGLGSMEVLMAVHAYWLEKRKKAGMALVRQLRVSPSDQIQSHRKKLLQKQRSIKLSVGGRHLGRNQGIGMGEGFNLDAESRVREARAAARVAAELAATKRAKAQRLMQVADLATYRAVAISKNAEAIQAIETSCSSGQFPNENWVTEEGSVRPFVEDLLNLTPWVDPIN